MFKVADAVSTEARAKNNDCLKRGDCNRYEGLTVWSPNINIFRDPRWGRGQETYGEDPYLTSRMGVEFVKGLQGNDPRYLKVISTPKHYAIHSGPESERHRFNAVIDDRDLYDTYLPAFEACVREGGAYSVMCAYNRYQGDACCANNTLLKKILRENWGFPGYVTTDCGAIYDMYMFHKTVPDKTAGSAAALKAGTDLECGDDYGSLVQAVRQGMVTETEVDVALKRLMTARFKLGMFDSPEMNPYRKIPVEEIDSPQHCQLSLRAARESIVLLKNENNLLPLKKDLKKIAVIGPTADDYLALLGDYYGWPPTFVTPLKGIQNKVSSQTEIVYEEGSNLAEDGGVLELIPNSSLNADEKPGLKAEYFNNRELTGNPILTRIDPLVDSNWQKLQKVPGLRVTDFSVRWSGTLTPKTSGKYVIAVTGDDGYRLWLDGKLVIDNWKVYGSGTIRTNANLTGGKPYQIKLEYFQGEYECEAALQWIPPHQDSFGNAVKLAKESDVVVFVGGITSRLEGEEMKVPLEGFSGGDRTSLDLPKVQERLLKALQATGKPIVLVLTSGSPIAVNWASEKIPAIVQLWYPGEEGGTALADVLFGDYNPAGRSPVTFYQSVNQLPAFTDYNMAGRTYRYFKDKPLYPFGYGLSYTQFTYRNVDMPKSIESGETLTVKVQVSNVGERAGDEVVQLYVKRMSASVPAPIQSLQGFKRVHLERGQTQTITFTLSPRQLSIIDKNNKRVVEPGEYQISVGGVLPGINSSSTQSSTTKLSVNGRAIEIK
jgi:beta-glucosidase